jgi:Domain of unknown function DUF29
MDTLSRNITHSQVYDQDFCLWLEQTANLLKERNLAELDIENLIEEIETMGRSEKRSVTSNLEIILIHLLKYKYQPQKRSNSWRYTLIEHRLRLLEEFENSPSLRKYFAEKLDNCYLRAKELASVETGLNMVTFPQESPFTSEQILDKSFLPEG